MAHLSYTGLGLALGAGLGLILLHRQSRQWRELYMREKELRAQERKGRTAAEQRLRLEAQAKAGVSGLRMLEVGRVRSPFTRRRGTPRQGSVAPLSKGRVCFQSSVVNYTALEGLEQFSHIWLLFVFHENTNPAQAADLQQGKCFQAKISPPRLCGKKVGLFSTRTPHRPNPIGLTMVKLEGINGNELLVSGLDLMDQTPILDIKPVVPYDIPDMLIVPDWVKEQPEEQLPVAFSSAAEAFLSEEMARKSPAVKLYTSLSELKQAIQQVLALDVRSIRQGRGKVTGEAFECSFDGLRLYFLNTVTGVEVSDIGYGARLAGISTQDAAMKNISGPLATSGLPLGVTPKDDIYTKTEGFLTQELELGEETENDKCRQQLKSAR